MGFNGDGVPVRLKTLSFCVRTRARVCVFVCVCTHTHSTLHFIRPLRISAQRVTIILPSCFPAEELKWRGTTDLIISLITVTLTLPEKQHGGNKGGFSANFICGNLPFIGWRQCHVIRDYQLIGWSTDHLIRSVQLWRALLLWYSGEVVTFPCGPSHLYKWSFYFYVSIVCQQLVGCWKDLRKYINVFKTMGLFAW